MCEGQWYFALGKAESLVQNGYACPLAKTRNTYQELSSFYFILHMNPRVNGVPKNSCLVSHVKARLRREGNVYGVNALTYEVTQRGC
jgi:hypothetical protein